MRFASDRATIGLWEVPLPHSLSLSVPAPSALPHSHHLPVAWANSLHLEQRFIALIVVVVIVAAFVDSPATVAALRCLSLPRYVTFLWALSPTDVCTSKCVLKIMK